MCFGIQNRAVNVFRNLEESGEMPACLVPGRAHCSILL